MLAPDHELAQRIRFAVNAQAGGKGRQRRDFTLTLLKLPEIHLLRLWCHATPPAPCKG